MRLLPPPRNLLPSYVLRILGHKYLPAKSSFPPGFLVATAGCNQACAFADVGIEPELIIVLAAIGLNHTGEVILEEPSETKVG